MQKRYVLLECCINGPLPPVAGLISSSYYLQLILMLLNNSLSFIVYRDKHWTTNEVTAQKNKAESFAL